MAMIAVGMGEGLLVAVNLVLERLDVNAALAMMLKP